MKKLSSIKNAFFFLGFFGVSFLFFLESCSKIDILTNSRERMSESERKFLTTNNRTNRTVLRIVDKLDSLNKNNRFIEKFAKSNGYPIWDKSFVTNIKSSKINRDSIGSNEDTLVLIPITPDLQQSINSILACSIINDSIGMQVLKREDYYKYGYNFANSTSPSAKEIAQLFMFFEYNVFNKFFFDIKDTVLAKKYFGDSVVLRNYHLTLEKESNSEEILFYKSVTAPSAMSYYNPVVQYPSSIIGLDLQFWLQYYYGTSPISGIPFWWLINGEDPSNTGAGGGGTNGNGTENDPPGWESPPCLITRTIENGLVVYSRQPCDYVMPTPCEKSIALKNSSLCRSLFANMRNSLNATPPPNHETAVSFNSATTLQTNEGPIFDCNSTINIPEANCPFNNGMLGIIHTHPCTCTLQTFSTQDLFVLYTAIKSNNPSNGGEPYGDPKSFVLGVATCQGTFFLTVKNLNEFIQFGSYAFGETRPTEEFERDFKAYIDKDITPAPEQTIKLLDLLTNKTAGIGIIKANNDFTSYEELTYENGQLISSPCN